MKNATESFKGIAGVGLQGGGAAAGASLAPLKVQKLAADAVKKLLLWESAGGF